MRTLNVEVDDMNATEPRTGRLILVGKKPLGFQMYEWWGCVDCAADYPRPPGGAVTCNGRVITLCPWCRPDSEPWKNGRGR